jgi:PAS domain S-box-containing protein
MENEYVETPIMDQYENEKLRARILELERLIPKQELEYRSESSVDSDLSFSDLIDIRDLQLLIDNLSELTGCAIGVLDINQNFLAKTGFQKVCACFHRTHSEAKIHCSESDRFIAENLKTNKAITYKCKNGLYDIAFPILIEGKHMANLIFGQFFFEDEGVDFPHFERQSRKYDFNTTAYLDSIKEVPLITRGKAQSLIGFISLWAKMLTQKAYSNLLLKRHNIEELKEARQALKESELRFRKLFEQAGVGVAQIESATGRLVRINKKFADIIGYSIEEMMQLTFRDFTHPDDLEESEANRNKLLNNSKEYFIEKRYLRKNGSIVWVSVTVTTILELEEGCQHHISIVKDIDDAKRAEKVLKDENVRFHVTMNAIDSIVYVADMVTHEILFVNKYVKDLFGDIAGEKCYAALQGKSKPCEFCTNHLLLGSTGEILPCHIWEFQNLITGNWYLCHDQVIQWTDGKLVRFEIATDITENKKAELTLKEHELKLEELNSTKDKLFAIISHDLKNPFAVMKTSSSLLYTYLENNNLSKSKAKAAMILNAANKGYALLENLLFWAKSQSNGIRFEPKELNLRKGVDESIRELDDHANGKNILLTNEIPDDLIFEADEHLLSVVFRNLITNAIKFTNGGGTIRIGAKIKGSVVEVAVIDSGIGIPKEHQFKLFRVDADFSRGGTANEVSTSLGLILCKEFIEKHEGKIWVVSEENEGCEFRFTLPYRQPGSDSISFCEGA